MTSEDELKVYRMIDQKYSSPLWPALALLFLSFTVIFLYQQTDFRLQVIEKQLGIPTPADKKEKS